MEIHVAPMSTCMSSHGVDIQPQCVSANKAAELLAIDPRSVKRHCNAGKYQGATKTTLNGVDVWRIPIASLPQSAQKKMRAEVAAAARSRIVDKGLPIQTQDAQHSAAELSILWEEYERTGEKKKQRAEQALQALKTFHGYVENGFSIGEAEKEVARRHGVSKPTLWRYRIATNGNPSSMWLPLLVPRYSGGRPPKEFTEEAYKWIHGKILNTSKTPIAVVITEARKMAREYGWIIPSNDSVYRRLNEEPGYLNIAGREGKKALEQSYPAIRRDFTALSVNELWESDGRKADVWCVWPDGTIERPFIIVWRDVRSRLVLGVKGLFNPTADGVLSAFGMALQRTGKAPDYAKIDNGREYAAKSVTGGQKNRYRFNVIHGEQPGVMTMCGTVAKWSKPGRGQDKPIESFWNFVKDRCDKSPEFEGAYCGSKPTEKPENFDKTKAIQIGVFAQKLASVLHEFNTVHRHSGSGMGGRTALEVYDALLPNGKGKQVDPSHFRLCYAGKALIKPGKKDGVYTLKIPGYGLKRYYSEELAILPEAVKEKKHAVYYDLENPRADVEIWDGQKRLGFAQLLEDSPFLHAGEAAADQVKRKNAYMNPKIAVVKQLKDNANEIQSSVATVTGLGALPHPIHQITFAETRRTSIHVNPDADPHPSLTEEDEKELAERRRKQQEKRRRANPALYEHVGT